MPPNPMSLHIDIVRDLAERGPFVDAEYGDCVACGSDCNSDPDTPANHEPTCLWRRVKALYPGSG